MSYLRKHRHSTSHPTPRERRKSKKRNFLVTYQHLLTQVGNAAAYGLCQ